MDFECKNCKTRFTVEEEKVFKNGVTHLEEKCASCGKHVRFVSQNLDNNVFEMPFGKHKGETIMDITLGDTPYARWAAENLKPNMADRFKECLSQSHSSMGL